MVVSLFHCIPSIAECCTSFRNLAPTFKESGYNLIGGIDRGVTVPAGTPKDRIKILGDALRHAASQKGFIDGMEKLGFHLVNIGPDEYAKFVEMRRAQYIKVLKDGGFLK